MHPDDTDGLLLAQQLQRIGCQVRNIWPPVQHLPEATDIVLLAVRPDFLHLPMIWAQGEQAPALVAVVNYENPTIVSAVLDLKALAILPSPIRSFGLLSTLVVARKTHRESRQMQLYIHKLQNKLLGQRGVTDAKAILIATHQVSEDRAYEMLREQAMKKRISIEEAAQAIIGASELLGMRGKPE
ncbi:TPA: ANTAR domain-containing protein [Pseudomonas aeruginosa]|nr:ANTAR domain-containing protein [Pseudomonas aeruginosa]